MPELGGASGRRPPEPAPVMSRLPGLDALRALAIVWVMLFHSFLVGGLGEDWAWLSRFGWAGVDMFFVLSGFLIGSQLLRQLSQGEPLAIARFYARRAWRILPAYGAVLGAYLWFPVLREVPGMAPAWQFASFTVNLLIDYGSQPAFSHAWSLCVEEHFYLLFPWLAWWLARRASVARVLTLAGALVLGGLLLRAAVWWHDTALDPPRNWYIEDLYYPTWMRLDGLLAGVLLASCRMARPGWWQAAQRRAPACLLAGLLLSGLALWLFRERTSLLANTLGWPMLSAGFALLVLGAARPSAAWRWPGAGLIASMSYSLYLSHKIAFHAVEQWMAPWLGTEGLPLFGVYALATLALGAALHGLVERPFLRWRDRRA